MQTILQPRAVSTQFKLAMKLEHGNNGFNDAVSWRRRRRDRSAMMYGLCLSLKNEIVKIAPKGRVNTIAPGTLFSSHHTDCDEVPGIGSIDCMRRMGEDTYGRRVAEGPAGCLPCIGDVRRVRQRICDIHELTWVRRMPSTPLKKVATPEDIAGQIVVMSSPSLSGHISGQVLMIEGGMEGRLLNERRDLGL